MNMKRSGSDNYISFLLRLWRTGANGKATWRASLESPMDGQRLNFAALKELYSYLESLIQEPGQSPAIDHDTAVEEFNE